MQDIFLKLYIDHRNSAVLSVQNVASKKIGIIFQGIAKSSSCLIFMPILSQQGHHRRSVMMTLAKDKKTGN